MLQDIFRVFRFFRVFRGFLCLIDCRSERMAAAFSQIMNDDPPSFAPDVMVERSSEDYVAGRDPMLERVLN
jgi:hypothetical protein